MADLTLCLRIIDKLTKEMRYVDAPVREQHRKKIIQVHEEIYHMLCSGGCS